MNSKLKLLTPLLFLKVKSREIFWVNWGVPIIFASLLTVTFYFAPLDVNVFGADGLIKSVNGLLAILVGFFIASLTAIAAFPSGGTLDKNMVGRPVTITMLQGGKWETRELTRRKFLCLLFGFDAFSSLLLYLFGEFAHLFAENIKQLTPSYCTVAASTAFLFFYLFWLSNLVATMLLGLHYLSERMHRE